jgi:tetratricopeptide (TPR) repeat protein
MKSIRIAIVTSLCLTGLSARLRGMDGMNMAPSARPAALVPGSGDCHRPIATSSSEAQKFFDQGLCLVYAFNHEEAIASFRKAAELDPKSPMPHWGIALADGPNINMDVDADHEKDAFQEIGIAQSLAGRAPEKERAMVAALAKRYSGDPKADLKSLDPVYRAAMKELVSRYPEDLDLVTLYAESVMDLRPWKFWSPDGKPAEDTEEIVAVLESVLTRDPNHVGANHYYIHAVEASPHPEKALPSALRLGNLAPAEGHLVHMPAHIYIHTGDWSLAYSCNQDAADVDRAFMKRAGDQGFYSIAYYGHNLHFIAYAGATEGRYRDARKAADLLVERVSPSVAAIPILEMWMPAPLFVELGFHRWDALLALSDPGEKLPTARAMWRFGRATALSAKKDRDAAEKEKAAYLEAVGKLPPDAILSMMNPAPAGFAVATHALEARMAAARGDRAAEIAEWKKAVEAEDALSYDEPPAWLFPVRDSLGAALLASGRSGEAEAVFRENLRRHPREGRSLFGLWKSLEAQKRTEDAAWVKREFDEAWKNADAPLSLADL